MPELVGEWWLPEHPDRPVAGTLTIDEDGAARLLLIGELRTVFERGETPVSEDGTTTSVEMTEEAMAKSGVYPRVVGQVGAKALTLEDCIATSSQRNLMGGVGTETLHCGQVFHGLAFGAGEPLEFDGLAFELKWLSHWLQRSGIEESHTFPVDAATSRGRSVTVTVKDLPADELQRPFGLLRLGHGWGVKGDRAIERTVTQTHYFRIEVPEVVPVLQLVDIASDVQDLVSIGLHRTAEFREMELLHPVAVQALRSGEEIRIGVDWYAQWNARDDSGKDNITEYDMFFTFEEFGGMGGLNRWLDVAERHRSALGRVMATRYSRHMYLSDRILNRAAALEAFDRTEWKHANSNFATRLRRCIDLAGDPFRDLVGDVTWWVQTFKDDRDDIAHHFGRRPRDDLGGQLYLAESAYCLFVMCMMRAAAAPDDAMARLSGHQWLRWIRRGLVASRS